ncbi:hypothetical protein M422DRAFT_242393 [Sphaerobolus stellatus SS14]|nr:hypothetical protein M422DRAFT_242393 [Sphaerobolus stellatus SS14]
MAPKKKTSDKVPAGTSDAVDSSSTPNVAGGNDPTLDPGKDPSQVASAASETNTIRPTTQSTHVTDYAYMRLLYNSTYNELTLRQLF